MPEFKNTRRRRHGEVSGSIVVAGDDSSPRSSVTYTTEGERWGEKCGPTVNWSAHGPVPVEDARLYAAQILAACDAAEVAPRPFEPGDPVTHKELEEDRKAMVRAVGEKGMTIETFVPGPDYEKTLRTHSASNVIWEEELELRRLTPEEIQAEHDAIHETERLDAAEGEGRR